MIGLEKRQKSRFKAKIKAFISSSSGLGDTYKSYPYQRVSTSSSDVWLSKLLPSVILLQCGIEHLWAGLSLPTLWEALHFFLLDNAMKWSINKLTASIFSHVPPFDIVSAFSKRVISFRFPFRNKDAKELSKNHLSVISHIHNIYGPTGARFL
jgi:hypothetical protein